MDWEHRLKIRGAFKLALFGGALVALGLCLPRDAAHQEESLWTVARDSTWHQLGDCPAASASLQIALVSCGLLVLLLAGRQLWADWLLPKYLHLLMLVCSVLPFVSLFAALYYLFKAIF
ncbi:MAG: hypothetical protein RLZZ350_2442 [Verrucomicrobiota bacterium]|jgi:hypothetical protein